MLIFSLKVANTFFDWLILTNEYSCIWYLYEIEEVNMYVRVW